ncbi:uncharacterized protein TRAVEDRAFT_75256 [Trametes versicolor FP-101664 SS1]|uniref:uncharacterized protein n=1 Tax=Trametes versicolor (strain FP-101664) TaxID=717944 RepID=UPI0004624785|nr:uncharacterized protein TRAVEDRAFT_75256 [Trametes versicolor FP-101664 SS1]EIW52134.1 hypothetical protein TRAVEDRAFT_75256 [Trametes versicolor FP-101664 SS1]
MPTETSYARLPLRSSRYDDSALEPLHIDDEGTPDEAYGDKPRPGRSSESFFWRLFIASCIVALALSALNLTALSAWTTISTLLPSTRPTASELKRPSPYLGLEKLAVEPSSCRSRATFPKSFYTYDTRAGSNAELTRVHAPGDQATLIFGGPVRAVADVYVADYGLENCTLNLRRNKDAALPQGAVDVEVYLRPAADRAGGVLSTFLDVLTFAPGKESISRPFHCASGSHVFLEWRCPASNCRVSLPLEGVTSMTSTTTSPSKTGFRVTQYEALHCIGV